MGFIIALLSCTIILGLFKILLRKSTLHKYKLPPGPLGLPFLGNVPQLIHNPHLKLSKWVDQYGSIYTINFGRRKALVVSDSKLMKEIFSLPESTGKYKTDTFLLATRGPYGVLNTEGESWSEQRQFLVRTLVKHGLGSKTTLESLILTEVDEVLNWITKEMKVHEKVSVVDIFRIAANNTLLTIVTGERLSLENVKVSQLLENLLNTMQYTVKSGLNFLPFLKYIAPSASGYNALDKASQDIHDFLKGYINQHKETFVPGIERDVIDSYLEHLRTVRDPKSSFYGELGVKNCTSSIGEIFNAGGETTPLTLDWLVLYLSHHHAVQVKLHEEIDRVIGKYREPSLQDKRNMPYTDAVISETLRKSSLMPIGIIHELLEDVDFHEYILPKGLLLIPNMYHAHHDKDVWTDPEVFRPERFLEEDKHGVQKRDNVVAFQPGRRTCPGEPLARDVIFLFVSKIFQTFQVFPDPDNPQPDFEPDVGIGLVAKPYKVCMKKRL